jgi:hypothetical protein
MNKRYTGLGPALHLFSHRSFLLMFIGEHRQTLAFFFFYTYLRTHEAEPLLRSHQLYSHSRTSQQFMGPESSIRCSQEHSTGLYPELYPSNPHHPVLYHFNIVHQPTTWSSQWSLSFWLSHQYPICIPFLPHSCYMPRASHP